MINFRISSCNRLNFFILLLLALFAFSSPAFSNDGSKKYTFGVVPQQAAGNLAKLWMPLLEKVSIDTGIQVVFRTAPNIPEFEKRLAAGEYDFAYMNPYHYAVFSQKPGYKAFAKEKDKHLTGIIVVREDSSIDQLEQLAGKTLGFPSPAAFAASILTRAELEKRDIAFVPKYVASHDSVYRAVERGLFAAGGGIIRTFKNIDPSIKDQLRILWTSQSFTPHAFAAHPTVPDSIVEKILTSLVGLAENQPNLLKALKFNSLQSADDSEWDDIRSLNLKTLDNHLTQ